MEKYRCKKCGYIIEGTIDKEAFCPQCDASCKTFIDETIDKRVWISEDNPCIARIQEKCINCGMCKSICENKTGISYDKTKVSKPICIHCGQCIMSCPTGALVPKYDYKKVLNYLNDTDYTVIVSIAPAVRVALGDEFGLEPGTFVLGKMINALKQLKFNYVFDLTFGADVTIAEEAFELVKRIKNKKNLPQLTSCCPSWVKYCEIYHDELLDNLSTTKSPISIQGALIKSNFAELSEIDPDKIINVMIAPCTAKKYEIKREELSGMDFVLTTTELAMMIREQNIDFENLKEEEFDSLFKSTGSGVIFGSSGGVMESALRTAYYILEKENPPKDFYNLESIRGLEEIKEATIKIKDLEFNVAAVYGMKNFETILPNLNKYTFIEVMNCPGGCIGGGGQPLIPVAKQQQYKEARMKNLYENDEKENVRCSYKNPEVANIYKVFLDYPESEKARKLLHTKYTSKKELLNK